MAGESLIVGYRADDSRRYLARQYGFGDTHPDGPCIDCGHQVYLNGSGLAAHRERDSVLLCRFCHEAGKQSRNRTVEIGYL
jgi:hypothetical protein